MSEFHIAFCIICHKYTPVLQELIDRLSVPGNGIFIHVDRKARMKDFAALNGKVRFVTPRIDIRWGDYGQICCMRRLYEATRSGDYRYIVLLSGDTLPLYDMTYIREFLAASYARNTEFVAMQPDLNLEEFYGKVRTAHYVPVLRWGGKRSLREKLRIKYAKHFRPARNPLFGKVPPLEKGCNWITITDRLRDYALEYARTHPDYNRFFRYTSCGDEIYFHTILGSSPLAGNNTRQSLMFADWNVPIGPKVLDNTDIDRLAALHTTPGGGEGRSPTSSRAKSPTTSTSSDSGKQSSANESPPVKTHLHDGPNRAVMFILHRRGRPGCCPHRKKHYLCRT